MCSLIERFGGEVFSAPSMKEVPIEDNEAALQAVREIIEGRVDDLVLLTGVGTEAMFRLAASQGLEQPLLEALKRIPLLVRGPKPAAVLHRLGLRCAVKASEPNTFADLLRAMDETGISLQGRTVAVQEYGIANPEFYDELKSRGATVVPVAVYNWTLPDDLSPLEEAVRRTIRGMFHAMLFTSAQQIRHVLRVADRMQVRAEFLRAADAVLIASIGPTCSDALRECGLAVGIEATPPKMAALVRAVMNALES